MPAAPSAPAAPTAPPEPVAVELGSIQQALAGAGTHRFLDLSGRFTFDERAQIAKGVSDLAQKTNAKVFVVAVPGKTDVNSFAPLHANLKLQTRDVLFIFSGEKRHLHSQAIPKSAGSEILQQTNKDFYKSQTTGVLMMFDKIAERLSTAATTATTVAPASSAPAQATRGRTVIPIEWVLLAVAAAVIAWALFRTNKKPAPKKPAPKS